MDDLSWSLYMPLLFLVLVYALGAIVTAVIGSRGNEERAERMRDLLFGLALAGAAYVVVLLLIALVSVPDLVTDMVIIVLVIGGFFALLLVVLFLVFELLLSRGPRRGPTAGDPPG